ncbi:hypothetical protein ABGB18_25100 [Nonomuraea sp. B12E4]|uniref:hypothetical protein n=1 Tax=Nonomuraea sp. B12E4 TaxID=3153564 RepID=UPI00325ECFA1
MYRPVRIAATLAAAGLLAAGGTTAASAVPGHIVLDGQGVKNPAGCYDGTRRPLTLDNHTATIVLLYEKPDCQGRVIRAVNPGTSTVEGHASSVHILS